VQRRSSEVVSGDGYQNPRGRIDCVCRLLEILSVNRVYYNTYTTIRTLQYIYYIWYICHIYATKHILQYVYYNTLGEVLVVFLGERATGPTACARPRLFFGFADRRKRRQTLSRDVHSYNTKALVALMKGGRSSQQATHSDVHHEYLSSI